MKWWLIRRRQFAPPPTGWRRRIGLREKIPSSARRNFFRTLGCLVGIQGLGIAGISRDLPFCEADRALLVGVLLKGGILVLLTLSVLFGSKAMRRSRSWKERFVYIAGWLATLTIVPVHAAVTGNG
ncbi:MAG TPA: hypothetical protein ENK43_16040 [Planctomycetes bacterium]|nr:hypothetical protein [Planctomycetota bacterium]